jgi:alpha-tubulin suppressor-like RCC1 family protein
LISACGHDNSAVITSESKVYVWGSNTSNKLGIKSQNPYEFAPKLLEELHSIEKISLGHNHSAAINTNKELFTWGHGFFGQLGHGGTNSISTPKKVEYMYTKFHKVKCGYYHTCAIDNKKKIYIWGRKKYNLSSDKDKDKPEPIDEFKNQSIKSIQVGQGFTVFLVSLFQLDKFFFNFY